MNCSPRTSVRHLAIVLSCAGLLFAYCGSVWTQEIKKDNPRIKELQQKRLAVLENIDTVANRCFLAGEATFEAAYEAKVTLHAARFELAETYDDRIKVCGDAVQDAIKFQQITQQLVDTAGAPMTAQLKLQAYVLETQIMLEKEKSNK